ncbi:MAG: glutamine--fructose-6-phosphate transaminase (isomerizing) [Pseudomonadales bacterium]|jgi:glucosamine--fructose-6-phosphate aminotransferase (isomerizing)
MCGIVGAIAERNVTGILLEGLQRLEYRGYDSAGLTVLSQSDGLQRVRRLGKVIELRDACESVAPNGYIGIAHTRWATHGKPSEENAHPHVSGNKVSVVHNGIVENHERLRSGLQELGYVFQSETDTEVIAHLLDSEVKKCADFHRAFDNTLDALEGAYALVAQHTDFPGLLMAARVGSPLVVGLGIGENYVASDPQALRPVTDRFIFLEEGEVIELTLEDIKIFGDNKDSIESRTVILDERRDAGDKGKFRHYMLKEIYEQPETVRQTLQGRITDKHVLDSAFGAGADVMFAKVKAVQIVACGSSYYTGIVASYWIEQYAGLTCSVEVASELRYRKVAVLQDTLLVTISQSGETADTLAALRNATDDNYLASLCLCNVPNSTLVRESDYCLMILAGMEICVASTKAFTNQLADLLLLVIALGKHNELTEDGEQELVSALASAPGILKKVLELDGEIRIMAQRFVDKDHALFLGRGTHYPIALEGALKLKEISYIHAEGYPAGELKHGPLALVDENMPVVAVAPGDELLEKLKSNLQEVKARGGELFIFADENSTFPEDSNVTIVRVPPCHSAISPIIYAIPMQLLAYHVAVFKGTDVDQPRNLAKSVTVE